MTEQSHGENDEEIGGEINMVDKERKEEEAVDEAISKISDIKKAAGEFKKNVAIIVKDMDVESKDWHFNVESHEKGVTVDIAIKLLITKKKVDRETPK